jgi:hypothetical protein
MPEETTTLRDAARCLARSTKGHGIQSSNLLSILRSGELKAGFYFLNGTTWIEIPFEYWHAIDSIKFRRIGRSDDPRSGTYKIRATEFPDQISRIICAKIENKQTASVEAVTEVVDAAAKSYEVVVKTSALSEYRQRPGYAEEKTTSNAGAPRKEGWREVCSYMGAYMAAHYRDTPQDRLKIGNSAREIFALAKADEVPDLPSADSIKDQVSKATKLLKKREFDLGARRQTAKPRE